MNKKLWLALIGLLVLSATAFANPVNIGGANWIDIGVADDGTIVGLNKDAELWISKDLGATWNKVPEAVGIRVSINSDASIIGLVAKDATLWISRDKGATWVQTKATACIDVCITKSIHFVTNTKGEVWSSTDFNTWTVTKAVNEIRAVFDGWKLVTISRDGGKAYTFAYKTPDLMPDYSTNGYGFIDVDVDPKGVIFATNAAGEIWSAKDEYKAVFTRVTELWDAIAVSASVKYLIIVNKKGEAWMLTR